jgi:hypothetical protein
VRVLPRICIACVFLVLIVGFLTAPGQSAQRAPEQTIFSDEHPIQHPVPLSRDVLAALLKTENARGVVDGSHTDKPAELFRAAEVHLGDPDEVDLIVTGVPPMSGADNDWFWIVRSARKNPNVILFAGATSLELMNGKTLGLRDIRTVWYGASETYDVIYHFDGKVYKSWKKTSKDNEP